MYSYDICINTNMSDCCYYTGTVGSMYGGRSADSSDLLSVADELMIRSVGGMIQMF